MSLRSEIGRFEGRRRRQARARLVRLLSFAALVLALCYGFYRLGESRLAADNRDLRERVSRLNEETERLETDANRAVAAGVAAGERVAALERLYQEGLPVGLSEQVIALVKDRLAAGVDRDRIALAIGAIQAEARCDPEPSTRRFLLQTPLGGGSHGSVSFADAVIDVTGTGSPARDAQGKLEAWFNPAEAVTITFNVLDGHTLEAAGTLPLERSVIVEHQFRVEASERRGFVVVSAQRCLYP